jgi:NAD(P)-dependent dehydrogenase (short-subunit alcohol dehydrogenase family)
MEKSILITGCSSGIGLAAAQTLIKRGYRVFATVRKEADVQKLQALGLESLVLDVTDSASIRSALNEILQRTGGTLFALFNNSGYVQAGAVEDLSRDSMRAQFETNVFGPMELITQVLPVMRQQGYGRIIQNSSMLGVVTRPYVGAYCASKFALDGFTYSLRQELRHSAIHIAIIAPGPITSQLRENAKKYFSPEINHNLSPHHQAYEAIAKRYSAEPSALDKYVSLSPESVVKKLIHALESSKPKTHYFIGAPAKIFALLQRLLSEKMLDWVMARFD